MTDSINKSLLRGVQSEYHKSLTAAFRIAAKRKGLSTFKPEDAKAQAREYVLGQVQAALETVDTGDDGK